MLVMCFSTSLGHSLTVKPTMPSEVAKRTLGAVEAQRLAGRQARALWPNMA